MSSRLPVSSNLGWRRRWVVAVALGILGILGMTSVRAAVVFVDSGQSLGGDDNSADVALGDVDGDGDLDAVVADSFVLGVNRLWLNNGDGVFADSGQNLGNRALSVALADLDFDGDLDAVFVGDTTSGSLRVWINQGGLQEGTPGVFQPNDQTIGQASRALALGELDDVAGPDVFVVRGLGNQVWFNDRTGQLVNSGQMLGSDNGRAVALGDLDGDGDLDAFVANELNTGDDPGPDRVWFNQGGIQGGTLGSFADSGQSLGGSPNSMAVALGDLDGDGDLDAFVAKSFIGEVWINQGNVQGGATGNFEANGQTLGLDDDTGLGFDVALGDLDGDGDLDAFIARFGADRIYLNDGAGRFTDSGLSLNSANARAVALGDLDGDGDLDAFVANLLSPDQVWFNESSATPTLTPDDFGPGAERIHFDNLQGDALLMYQLTMQGVHLRAADGRALLVTDPLDVDGGPAHSSPYAVRIDPDGLPISIDLRSPRRQVGLYFGVPNAPDAIRAVLRAYGADGAFLEEATVKVDAATASRLMNFIGVGVGVAEQDIGRVELGFDGDPGMVFIDDLLIDPRHGAHPDVVEGVVPLEQILRSITATVEEKIEAIAALVLLPSEAASVALQETAKSDPDFYVRERSMMGLTQLRDPGAVPLLVSIGLAPANDALRQAAHNAVWVLRRLFPLPAPPEITIEAITPIESGEPFTVEVRVHSPVDRAHVQVRFKSSKALPVVTRDVKPGAFEGRMRAGEEIVLQVEYLAPKEGQASIPVIVRVSEDMVDATSYPTRLYVDVRPEGSVTSMTPFPEWTTGIRHIVSGSDDDPLAPARNGIRPAAAPGHRDIVVSGSVTYQDCDASPAIVDGSGSVTVINTPVGDPKPGILIKVKVVDAADRDDEYGEGWTDSQGVFFVVAEEVPDNRNLEILLEVDNSITKLYLDTDLDVGGEEFIHTLAGVNSGTFGGINIGANVVQPTYRTLTVDENGFWPGGQETHQVSFAAAMNVNEVIRVTRAEMDNNRDPGEGDSIGQVDVEYGDSGGTHYFADLVLTATSINGLLHPNNPSGMDDAWVDSTVAHEYTHHLQFEIGAWDGHAGGHVFCREIESFWWNASEFAFSEGFANYLGNFIALTKPDMSQVQVNSVEAGCVSPVFTSTPRSQEAHFNVEGHITAFLWDLSDGWGRGDDSWDQVDGPSINGHRTILQIFDRELDDGGKFNIFDDAPDLREFYQAWLDRFPGLDFIAGHPVADAILNANGLVPGSAPGQANRPFPVVEGNPMLPGEGLARLVLPDGTGMIPQYDPPIAAAHVPGQPVLTIRRQWSYIDAIPGTPNPSADQVTVQLGFSNLGAVTMEVDVPVAVESTASANWTANIVYSPNASGWLSVSPVSGGFSSATAFDLVPLVIEFTPAMQNLAGSERYTADIELTYQTLNQTEIRLIRVILDQWVGPDEDTDGDGLTNREERDLAQSNLGAFGCLRPRDADSDDDGLSDGDEIRIHGTSPCNRDTDGDGMWDGLEVRYPCLDPLVADADVDHDMDGLTTAEELLVTFQTDPCDPDFDDDGVLDGFDNCRFTPNPDQLDLDGDGRGDACDSDIDGDGCLNLYDPNPTDVDNPDEACLARPADPSLTRSGRLITELDHRLEDARLHLVLDGWRPNGPDSCGGVECPPPSVTVFEENGERLSEFLADTFGFDQFSGFATTAELLPDLDGDGIHDLAIGVPGALDGAGVILIVSTRSGEVLGRLEGTSPGSRLGESMVLRNLEELAIGAPGNDEIGGAVHLVRLAGFIMEEPIGNGQPGDRFGASLLAVARDGTDAVLVGAPGDTGRGAVFAWNGEGAPERIADGTAIGDEFGAALARAGDLTGDGEAEVLVGAPGANRPLDAVASRLAPHDAGPLDNHLGGTGEITLLSLTGRRIWSRVGTEPNERFGAALAALSMIEGPVFQFLVGAPGWQNRTGRAYVVTADNEVSLVIPGERENAELGRWVGAGPDYDGDGFPSLLTGEPGVSGPETQPGRTTAFQAFARPVLGATRVREDGRLELSVHGRLGVEYQIEASEDLSAWTVIERVVAVNTVVRFTDSPGAAIGTRFYRLSTVTP